MRLTREERAQLFHRQAPRIVRDERPCEVGAVISLSSKLQIEVTGFTRTRNGQWRVGYLVRDSRPRLLRRVPRMHQPQVDANGRPVPPGRDAVAAARLDSSYTTTAYGSIPTAGEAVDDFTLRRLTEEARDREMAHAEALVAAAAATLAVIEERCAAQPTLRKPTWPVRRELNRLIERERNRAA